MKNLSINNGNSFCTVTEALESIDFKVIINVMDDEIREMVHAELAPCTDEAFLTRYLELAKEDLIVG